MYFLTRTIMKHIYKYFLGLLALGAVACKKEQPDVEYSPIFPISGEWHVHLYNEDGTNVNANLYSFSTYNTSNNDSDIAWMKLSTVAQPFGVLAKVKVDVPNKSFVAGEYVNTLAVSNKSINLVEGKILLNASPQPSKVVADSIFVKYKTGVNGKTYVVKGHRRTQWPEDQR